MSAFAQKANDTTGIFFINASGGIHNHAGTKLGYIDKNSMVRDNTGKELHLIDNTETLSVLAAKIRYGQKE
ncbi:hypothetical protein ACVW0P_004444 [Mucilaginibacter sp. UYNi724]